MAIIDDLEEEAKELQRQEKNLTEQIAQHRVSVLKMIYGKPPQEEVQRLIKVLSMTDFKGYFRDKRG